MATPPKGLTFRSFLRSLPREVLVGVLRAFSILPMPQPKAPIGYWARNERGQWELRTPATGRTKGHLLKQAGRIGTAGLPDRTRSGDSASAS